MSEEVLERSEVKRHPKFKIYAEGISRRFGTEDLADAFDVLGHRLKKGVPVLLKLSANGDEDSRKILFLSNGKFEQDDGFRAKSNGCGCAIAVIDSNQDYTIIHANSNIVARSKILQQKVVKKIAIGDEPLAKYHHAIDALRFAGKSVFIDPSKHGIKGQNENFGVSADFIRTVLNGVVSNGPVMVPKGKGFFTIDCPDFGFRQVPESFEGIVNPRTDVLVYENRVNGRDIGFIKFEQNGGAFFLPSKNMHAFVEKAFSPDFVRKFYPEA